MPKRPTFGRLDTARFLLVPKRGGPAVAGVTVVGLTNLPGLVPTTASTLFSNNITQFVNTLVREGEDWNAANTAVAGVRETLERALHFHSERVPGTPGTIADARSIPPSGLGSIRRMYCKKPLLRQSNHANVSL